LPAALIKKIGKTYKYHLTGPRRAGHRLLNVKDLYMIPEPQRRLPAGTLARSGKDLVRLVLEGSSLCWHCHPYRRYRR